MTFWGDMRENFQAFREGIWDNGNELRELVATSKSYYREMLAELERQRKALEAFAADTVDRSRTGEDSVAETTVGDFTAIVRHCRDGLKGRVDLWYRPRIYFDQMPYTIQEANFTEAHAVIRHSVLVEWWLIESEGRVRVDGMRELSETRAFFGALGVVWRAKEHADRRRAVAELPALEAVAQLATSDKGAFRKALRNALNAVTVSDAGHDQKRDEAIERHLDVLQAALAEQRAFNERFVDGKTGTLVRHLMLPGYYARVTFSESNPNWFHVFYSGDGGSPFGEHQGMFEFRGNSISEWVLLGGKVKHLRIV